MNRPSWDSLGHDPQQRLVVVSAVVWVAGDGLGGVNVDGHGMIVTMVAL
jgi:hypothetical protein